MQLPSSWQQQLDQVVERLASALRANLHACAVYGSAIRGDFDPATSDLNLLIVLVESTPAAHAAIVEILAEHARVEPFIVGRRDLARVMRLFGLKFRSISRNYRVLMGADPFADFDLDASTVRFLCEQSLFNLRLRTTHAFVTAGRSARPYAQYLDGIRADALVVLSEIARMCDVVVPNEPEGRIAVFERVFESDASILHELIARKGKSYTPAFDENARHHAAFLRLLDRAIDLVVTRWPTP